MSTEFHIFTGHFGSGKTEVALNFALKKRREGRNVTIIDIDTVNPYFRTKDAEEILKSNGIKLIASEFASTNIDMPTVPAQVLRVFYEENCAVIFDVGGDEDGAYAIGQYKRFFDKLGYEMHFVVNTKRPLTKTAQDLSEIADKIQSASRLHFTDIYNNTNLSYLTDENTLMSDYKEIEKLSQILKVPVTKQCGIPKALKNVKNNTFSMEINIKMEW